MSPTSKLTIVNNIEGVPYSKLCTATKTSTDQKLFFAYHDEKGIIERNSLPIQQPKINHLQTNINKSRIICGLEIGEGETNHSKLMTIVREEKLHASGPIRVTHRAQYMSFNEETRRQIKLLDDVRLQDHKWPSDLRSLNDSLQPGYDAGEFFFITFWFSGQSDVWTSFVVYHIMKDENGKVKSQKLKDKKIKGRWFQPFVLRDCEKMQFMMLKKEDNFPEMLIQSLSAKDTQFSVVKIGSNSMFDRPPHDGKWSPPRYFAGMIFFYIFSAVRKLGTMWALELGSNSWLQMSDYVLSRDNHAGARYLALCIQQNGECLFHAGLCGTHGCLKGHWYHGDIQSFVIQRQYTIMKYQAATIDEKNVTINYQTELINKKDAKISHQTELIGQKTTTITYQIRLIDEKNATIDHQKALIDEKNTKISDQTEHLNELKKSLKKNQLLKEQANVENRIIEDQLSQATLRKRSLEQQISKSTTEKLQLQSDIAQQQIRVDHLSEEKRRLENENMHMQAKIDKLEYQLKEKIDQIAHINFTQIEQNQKWFVKLASQFPIFRTSKNKEAKIVHNQLQEQEATVGSSNREKQIIKNLQGALLDKTLQLKVANEKLDAATFMMYENSSQKHADHCATPEARPRTEKREVTRKRYAESTHHQVLKTSKTEEKPSHVLKNDEKSEDETLGHIATGMCKQDNRRLIKNLPYLCHTVDHLMVSTTLLSKAIFTQHEVELISQESTSYSKRLKLINILTTKGSNAFPAFITALNDAGQNFISNILLSSSKTDDKNPSSNLVDASEPENQGTFHERDIPFIDGNETEQQSASAIKYEYVPASREFLSSTAAMLNITLNISSIIIRLESPRYFMSTEAPYTLRKIQKDGNSFFRALSVLFFGSESRYYSQLRAVITQYIGKDENRKFSKYLSESAYQYLSRTRMREDGILATKTEIFATAALFNCNVFVFDRVSPLQNNQWTCYNSNMSSEDTTKGVPSFLLNHAHSHFDAVLRL